MSYFKTDQVIIVTTFRAEMISKCGRVSNDMDLEKTSLSFVLAFWPSQYQGHVKPVN